MDPLTTSGVAPTESIPSRPVRTSERLASDSHVPILCSVDVDDDHDARMVIEPTDSLLENAGESQPWWKQLFRLPSAVSNYTKMRKVPVKVEPKVFFANERTFLAWLNMAVTLASISIAIMAYVANRTCCLRILQLTQLPSCSQICRQQRMVDDLRHLPHARGHRLLCICARDLSATRVDDSAP